MSALEIKPLNITDSFDRPLYKDKHGKYYCDVTLGKYSRPDIHCKDSKEGEPSHRIRDFDIVELTEADIILETINYIHTHGRSVNYADDGAPNCMYVDEKGNHCAVGRCMDRRKYNTDWEGGSLGAVIRDHDLGKHDNILRKKYRGHTFEFWSWLQSLHDKVDYWEDSKSSPKINHLGMQQVRTRVMDFDFSQVKSSR